MLGLGYFPRATGETQSADGQSEDWDYIESLRAEERIYSQIFGVNVERFENLAIHPTSLVVGGWDGALTPDRSQLIWVDIAQDRKWSLGINRIGFGDFGRQQQMVGTAG